MGTFLFNLLLIVGFAAFVYFGWKYQPKKNFESSCTGDCNQGRDCTCKDEGKE